MSAQDNMLVNLYAGITLEQPAVVIKNHQRPCHNKVVVTTQEQVHATPKKLAVKVVSCERDLRTCEHSQPGVENADAVVELGDHANASVGELVFDEGVEDSRLCGVQEDLLACRKVVCWWPWHSWRKIVER